MAKWESCDRCGRMMPEGEFATRLPKRLCIPCLNGSVKGELKNRIVKGSDLIQRDQVKRSLMFAVGDGVEFSSMESASFSTPEGAK